ncbi:MAG: hypothetical protein LC808_33205 [Actinobacteria bacterium]|nr:hypothetical protein [Actinomycetota bacterium]
MSNPEGSERSLDGRGMVTRVALPTLLATTVLVLLLALLLRPVIESSAKDAATEAVQGPLERAQSQIADLAKKVGAKPPAALTQAGDQPSVVSVDGRLEAGGVESFSVPKGQTLSVTDLILENPDGASGTISVARGDSPLLELRLDNFRDLDYHFVSPIVFQAGEELVLRATCTGSASCSPALYYVGSIEKQ